MAQAVAIRRYRSVSHNLGSCPKLDQINKKTTSRYPNETAGMVVAKAGKMVGVPLRPHDLRQYAATYASRSGVPIEIVIKVILRHSNLSTTQRYLGKITDTEAMRWIENLYA
jgi:integrase